MYDLIRAQMAKSVPFAAFVGVELLEVGAGTAVASLDQRPDTSNHLGTQHAGALYTLGETASGGAMAGAFAAQLATLRPLAAQAEISYLRIAKGRIDARAHVTEPVEDLLARLAADGSVRFTIAVDLTDASAATVATLAVQWHVSARRA